MNLYDICLHVVVVLSSSCDSMSPLCLSSGESVLCLDGGGIRGLVQLEILHHIEDLTHRRIVNLFDWIVGTSTGGILALGLVYGVCCLSKGCGLYKFFKFFRGGGGGGELRLGGIEAGWGDNSRATPLCSLPTSLPSLPPSFLPPSLSPSLPPSLPPSLTEY